MQHDEVLPLFFVGYAGNDKGLLGEAGDFVQPLFNLHMRHHFAPNFAKAAEAVSDGEEAVLILRGDIAGDVPAVAQHLFGFLRLAEITLHNVRPAHDQESGRALRNKLVRFGIDDAHADAGKRLADRAAFRADLSKTWRSKIPRVDSNNWRAFGCTITFQRADAEAVLEGERDAFRQFFRSDEHIFKAAKIFGRTAAHVGLQESWRRH